MAMGIFLLSKSGGDKGSPSKQEVRIGNTTTTGVDFTTLDSGTASGRVDNIAVSTVYPSEKESPTIGALFERYFGVFSASADRTAPTTSTSTVGGANGTWPNTPTSFVLYSTDSGSSWTKTEGTISNVTPFPFSDIKYYGY